MKSLIAGSAPYFLKGFLLKGLVLGLPLLWVTAAWADGREAVLGRWVSETSIFEVTANGDSLTGRVVALMNPLYTEGEEFGPVGATRRDDLNPDVNLRTRSILGLEIISEYEFTGKKWQGKIYDPESGKTYSSNMHVAKDGSLKMRGYIGVPMLGRTAIFRPVSLCGEQTVAMLRSAQLEGCGVVRPVFKKQ